MTTLFVCPFCGETVVSAVLEDDLIEIEYRLRRHLLQEHPIRWRLSRKYRQAMKK